MLLNSKKELCHLLPHSGAMCLLDSVLHWDATTIVCTASSHTEPQNPLRLREGLETVCGLEYAAQAIGVHICLTASSTNKGLAMGYLGGIKHVKFHSPHLHTFSDGLEIQSEILLGQETSFIYSFIVKAGLMVLLEGRASIFVKYLL